MCDFMFSFHVFHADLLLLDRPLVLQAVYDSFTDAYENTKGSY